jgi:Gpi16 subunit, GPI transamidase component
MLAGSLLQAEFRSLDQKLSCANFSSRNRMGQTKLHGCTGGGVDADERPCVGLPCAGGSDRISIGDRWRLLKALTSGVFCASLNKNTVFSSPFYFDAPRHESSASVRVGQYFPEESVCTENIDVWKKLIPNVPFHQEDSTADSTTIGYESDQDGLKGLVDKNWLLYSPWHSLRFEAFSGIERNATDSLNTSKHKTWRSKQELSMTLRVSAILLPKTLPSHAIVLKHLEEYILKRKNSGLKSDPTHYTHTSANKLLERSGARLHRQVKDSRERKFFAEMIVEDSSSTTVPEERSLPLGSRKGSVTSQDSYPKKAVSTRVHVTELLPPFYDILLHTYTYTIIQKIPINPKNVTSTKELYVADLGSFKFHPGGVNDNECYNRNNHKNSPEGYEGSPSSDYGEISRSCYGSVSWTVDLPPGAVLRSQFTAEKKHLHREQYPSDASRGFIVPPVFVTLTSKASTLGKI